MLLRVSQELDRYSAALAGTHFLRQQRDQVMKETINSLAYLYLAVRTLRARLRQGDGGILQ